MGYQQVHNIKKKQTANGHCKARAARKILRVGHTVAKHVTDKSN